ncbi:MAG: efflux RND transporter permease subunit [Polyangia bacterium]
MWIVRLALKRPYTIVVMTLMIVLMGAFSIDTMPTDIFPNIDIPVVSVIWNFAGLPPEEIERRVTTNYERFLTTVVNDIEHVESQSLTGICVIKVFLQPGASIDAAVAQIVAVSQTALRTMPPGATPPLVIQYSAANVPVIQASLESDTLSEQALFDLGFNFVRTDIATIKGAQIPYPYGGKMRQVMIDIDPERLYGAGLSPRDISNVIGTQNIIVPGGTTKIGSREYPVLINSSPELVDEINAIPIKTINGKTIFMRDVSNVRDGNAPQTSIVHVGGKKAALMTILKSGKSSTLDVTGRVKAMLPNILTKIPKELKVKLLFDQSLFVRAAVSGVVEEAAIAAGLTALMILVFLGSWRSTFIVVLSIPLAILTSITILGLLGKTLNVMTLGGLSLAVGILVDDATVEIENIHRNLLQKKPLVHAIMDGAYQIATPALVATLCICIVFVPVGFITGSAKSLFVPMAMAVVFAMLMSYVLSRTLVPTMVRALLKGEAAMYIKGEHDRSWFGRFHERFNHRFDHLRSGYGGLIAWALERRGLLIACFLGFAALSMCLFLFIGKDFFPTVDAGLIKLHCRGVPGTRIEETEARFAEIEAAIHEVIPAEEIDILIDNMGIPSSGINLSLSEGALISSADGQIQIALKEGHKATDLYVQKLRRVLRQKFPDFTFFFLAPDISTQVLNFGLPAPIDIQLIGAVGTQDAVLAMARRIEGELRRVPGAADVHLAQVQDRPELRVDVDRTLASRMGLTERDVSSDLLVSLSSSGQVAPSFWVDKRGVQYLVAVQTPQYKMNSVAALERTPMSIIAAGNTPAALAGGSPDSAGVGSLSPQLLSNVATVHRVAGVVNITHYNTQRTYDVQANVEGTDLGSVSDAIDGILERMKKDYPRGLKVKVKGQVESMNSSFRGLGYGLVFAIVLVYLLMAVNFQSWIDPLIILTALPGALAGICWMLFVSQTTLSVPALMGSIMCVGVATANSILVVTFANDQRVAGRDAVQAALAAGMTRLRPVIMTALAMIIGMLPMSLGLGEGGEQNAPLGRAVIGGLTFATFTTLFFVPVMYSLLRKKAQEVDEEVESL